MGGAPISVWTVAERAGRQTARRQTQTTAGANGGPRQIRRHAQGQAGFDLGKNATDDLDSRCQAKKIAFVADKQRKIVKILNATETQTLRANAFTLLELLVVIAIMGILAALTVPVLKNFGKSDATLGAARQLLDDVARARQLAISDRTTIYMLFIATNFFTGTPFGLPI